MKILELDIETSPNTAYVWSLWKENIPLARLIESSEVICYTAKWFGEKHVYFDSVYHSTRKAMLRGIHRLLDEADVVVHFNGMSFDIPCLNREFLKAKMRPPSPYKQVDLLQVVKRQFRFASNKMDYICQQLGIGEKMSTEFTLWVRCMQNEPKAWEEMKKYNNHDVRLLEGLYNYLMPWIRNHPNHGLFSEGETVCPNCGGRHIHQRGDTFAHALRYKRYQCQECGKWFRGVKPINLKTKPQFREIV